MNNPVIIGSFVVIGIGLFGLGVVAKTYLEKKPHVYSQATTEPWGEDNKKVKNNIRTSRYGDDPEPSSGGKKTKRRNSKKRHNTKKNGK